MIPAFLYTLWRIGAALGGGVKNALPWGHYLRVLALAAAVGVADWGVLEVLDASTWVRVVVGVVGYLAVFGAIGRVLGMIGKEDTRYLREWLSLRMLRAERGKGAPPPAH